MDGAGSALLGCLEPKPISSRRRRIGHAPAMIVDEIIAFTRRPVSRDDIRHLFRPAGHS
jgi:hypothetical protein